MKLPEGKKCYNAGKISGLSILGASAKFAKFDKFIATEMGMIPINPMQHGLSWNQPWLFPAKLMQAVVKAEGMV